LFAPKKGTMDDSFRCHDLDSRSDEEGQNAIKWGGDF